MRLPSSKRLLIVVLFFLVIKKGLVGGSLHFIITFRVLSNTILPLSVTPSFCVLGFVVQLNILPAKLNSLINMIGECWIECVFFYKHFCEFEVVVALVEEDAVGALGVDFDFDDGCMEGVVPMRGPLALVLS